MHIEKNYDLTKFNTFSVTVRANFFAEVSTEAELETLFGDPIFKNNQKLFLGGGSNVLFIQDFDGIVILNKLKGIEILSESENEVFVRSMSGEIWHDLVLFVIAHEYWGIENLSFIPGTVGAAPMQNIGAYGAELKNVLENVEALEVDTGVHRTFSREECELGYRDSVFKNALKGKYFILAITLKLKKQGEKNTSYKILAEHLSANKIEVKKPKDISDAVTYIRQTKLPDPKVIGNAGSFFKNVFVTKEKLDELRKEYPAVPSFEEAGAMKIPSGWLIEQCGPASGTSWKGYKVGNVGVHERQALVLVNHGGASGLEIKKLAEEIIQAVYDKFGLKLVPEVNLI